MKMISIYVKLVKSPYQKSTRICSRLYRYYVDVNKTDKWIVHKEIEGSLFHFYSKNIYKNQILDLDFNSILSTEIKDSYYGYWIKDESSFYYLNFNNIYIKYRY